MVHREALTSRPGTTVQYSDAGFILLCEVVETVTGTPLDAFCQHEIFVPLHLGDMAFRPLSNRGLPAWHSRVRSSAHGVGASWRERCMTKMPGLWVG